MTFRRRSFRVDPGVQEVVKFLPIMPPDRGETILVDGVRCRVTRCSVRWREPGVWTIRKLRVVRIGRGGKAGRMGSAGWPLGGIAELAAERRSEATSTASSPVGDTEELAPQKTTGAREGDQP